MTEPKKVAFSTIGSMKKEKKREKKVKSLRIALTLAESNEKSCPEFNYRELLTQRLHERIGKKSLGDVINGPSLDPSDPFCTDEDAALKALAKKFETKYGTATPNRKKKRRKENDFSTLGEGYDETDPFIDNSDAFDEVVPTHLETKHRGFYINSGELDFETVPEASSEEDTVSNGSEVRRRRPNQIASDDEEDIEVGEEERVEVEEEDDEVQVKKRKLSENGFIRHKKRKLDEGELLRRRKKMIGQFNAKNQEKKDSDQETEKPINGSEGKGEGIPNEENIKASIEAVVTKARQEAVEGKEESDESQSSSSNSSSSDSDSSGSSSSSGSDSEEDGGQQEEEVQGDQENENGNEEEEEEEGAGEEVDAPSASNDAHHASDTDDNIPLPDNLPTDLTQVISRLKEEGRTRKGSSQKFFTDSVNKLLLSIEMKLNKLGGRKRTQIYSHLSQHLPCGTQTIVKRAKNLLTEKQETKLQEPLKRLKEAVDATMPPLLERHALECQKAAESNPQQYWELYYHFWGENGVTQNEDEENNEGDKKKSRLPKKKFLFTDEMRKLLNDVVQVRVSFWQMIRKRSETPEEYIRLFLDTEVRPIWPKGWITTRILYKESHDAHSAITDRSYSRSVAVKKQVSLGGGSVVTSTPQPPRPSLSATVLPKSSSTTSGTSTPTTKPKGEPAKRKSISGDNREAVITPGKQQPEERLTASSGVLTIKSVEKINEDVPKTTGEEGERVPENKERKGNGESVGRDKLLSEKKTATIASSSVSIIDLSSDEEKTLLNKASSLLGTKSVSVITAVKDNKVSDESFVAPSQNVQGSRSSKADALPSEPKKEDNLEEEMNLVMNEILQISKKKSADDSLDRTIKEPSDNLPSSSLPISSSSTSMKHHHQHQSSSQSQESYHHHQTQLQKQESRSSSTTVKLEQPSVSPGKQSSGSPAKLSQPSLSPVKPPVISPAKQEQNSPTSSKHHTSQHHQPGQSEKLTSHPHERHTPKTSFADHSKHTSQTSQEKHSSEHHSVLHSQKPASQHHTSADSHQKHSPKLHSSKQERQAHSTHSLPTVEPKSPLQNQLQHSYSSLQHHSPSQHTSKQPQQHSLHQSQHSQRQQPQQQPLNLQQPKQQQQQQQQQQPQQQQQQQQQKQQQQQQQQQKQQQQQQPQQQKQQQQKQQQQQQQQQHPLNLQQPKAQHAPPTYHHSSSSSTPQFSSLPQPRSTSPEPSRHKKQQSHHYSQSHHHSQSHSKPSITSSWSSSDMAMISKTSPTSTSKTHSSWSSGHDVISSRQRQSDIPMGSGSKKSTSSSGSSTSAKVTTSVPVLGGSSVGLHPTPNKTTAHNYTSSQSKQSAPSLSYSSSSQHSTTAKARLDPYVASMSQSLYGGLTAEQQLASYKQLQQHQQTSHLTPHQQQELWQQMSSSGFLPGMSGMSTTDMIKLMSQMGKPMDSYTTASQHGQKRPGQRHSQF
ncbi:ubinuclein-1-like isoform X2 [Eriocheir sinensis]|uniref:ubinuclein-1-like isoform X2 n=1 Tax=Eriocheir sinensis TaxID=95602 RepID=UPI0021C79792|nr:ubinuclein-1-like isoform X2 [Eriocheir sinensis]